MQRFNHDKKLPPPPPPPPFKSTSTSSAPSLRLARQQQQQQQQQQIPSPPPRPLNLDFRSVPNVQTSSSSSSKFDPIKASNAPTSSNIKPEINSTNTRNSIHSQSSLYKPKTLKRRNLKALTITDSIGNPSEQMKLNDPDTKASTDELVSSMNNLELGVEYQLSIKAEDLLTLKKLGSGNSGTVSKVLHLPSKKTMARKIIHIETKEAVLTQIIRELRIMHECDSPSIIGFYGAFLKEGDVVICMEYVDCGSLDKILKLIGPFPEFMLKQAAYSVLSGLIYLYETHKIIHRDVKPSNVLMDSKGNMKLCDFGVSRELINSIADTFVGTSTYMSPERIQGNRYNVKGDVWSLGLMMIELATGEFPFGDSSKMAPEGILDLLQRIVNEKPPSLNVKDGFSNELCEFVDLCLKTENERWDPQELIKHPFLSNMSDDKAKVKSWAKTVRKLQKGKIMIVSSDENNVAAAAPVAAPLASRVNK